MKTGKIENEAFEQGGVPRKDGRGGTSGAFARRTVRRRSRRRVVIRCRTVSIPRGIGGPQFAAEWFDPVRDRRAAASRLRRPAFRVRIMRALRRLRPEKRLPNGFDPVRDRRAAASPLRRPASGVPSQAAPRMVRPRKRSAARSRPLAEGCNSRELVASLSARLRAFDIAAALFSGESEKGQRRSRAVL